MSFTLFIKLKLTFLTLEKMSKPCLGLSPLIDGRTNTEYKCGKPSEDCPAFSYCHKGDTFSKCCPFPSKDGKIIIFLN